MSPAPHDVTAHRRVAAAIGEVAAARGLWWHVQTPLHPLAAETTNDEQWVFLRACSGSGDASAVT